MKNRILLLGSGAIGRGYLPWIFDPAVTAFSFVDRNAELIQSLKSRRKYRTYRVRHGDLLSMDVDVDGAYTIGEWEAEADKNRYAAIFVSVGPRNCQALGPSLRGYEGPVVLCENDPKTVDVVKALTGKSNIYFAIPDVITSNTANAGLLAEDPLSVITESGTMFIDHNVRGLAGDYVAADEAELRKQWTAKLFLHNTPHCIAAYLGALTKQTYVHEAMAIPSIHAIVSGAMEEMLISLKRQWDIPHDFLEWYAKKELERFSDPLLCDPILRVAREPFRKLDLDGRLIGAAQICLGLGVYPLNLLKGITAALLYDDERDQDQHIRFMRKYIPGPVMFSTVLGLRRGEALENLLTQNFERFVNELEEIQRQEVGRV